MLIYLFISTISHPNYIYQKPFSLKNSAQTVVIHIFSYWKRINLSGIHIRVKYLSTVPSSLRINKFDFSPTANPISNSLVRITSGESGFIVISNLF